MNAPTPATPNTERTLTRRVVTTGAAWTVPAIAVAAAAPLAAASPTTKPIVTPSNGTTITNWKGDHHYGSDNKNPSRRSYDFPVFVTDSNGAAINNATVTVVAAGKNRDGDILGVYTYPAPSNGGPESSPSEHATLNVGTAGRYLFAVNTQNLSSHERPATATLTITATTATGSTSSTVTVELTETD